MPKQLDFVAQLRGAAFANKSFLCVGLDPEPARFYGEWKDNPARIFDFCAKIIEQTAEFACSFKPQIAYFAAHGAENQLEKIIRHIQDNLKTPVILDAKRGDIGSTAEQYAREAFSRYGADALTVSPFMGWETMQPYLNCAGRGLFALCRTSNPGGDDFQALTIQNPDNGKSEYLFEYLARGAENHAERARLGLVVGATRPADVVQVRSAAPRAMLLVPGVGAQGGDAQAVMAAARPGSGILEDYSAAEIDNLARDYNLNKTQIEKWIMAGLGNIVINSSRAILYAGNEGNWLQASREAARSTRDMLNAAAGI